MPRRKASMARAVSPFSSASMARAPASALPSISGSPGAAAHGLRDVAFHLGGVPPQRVYLGAEDEHDGAGLSEPEPGAGLERGLGVTFGRVKVESEHGRGGELQADDRTGAGRA